MTRRWWVACGVIAAVLAGAPALRAYLKLGQRVGTQTVMVKWTRLPVRYFITNRDVPGVNANQLRDAVASAFGRWTGLTDVTLSSQFVNFTSADPFVNDNASVVGFRLRADLDRTLGATTFNVDTVTGEILESDIFLNSSFPWSVSPGGETGRYDVESIATHELGHLFGLGHSMLGETELLDGGRRRVLGKRAVMFPIAYPAGNIEDRTPEPDDIAGMSDTYGNAAFRGRTGQISGTVTLNGTGLFGAHVTAFNSSTGATVASFSLNQQGDFLISGLTPGLYIVRAEPLDDADADSFFADDTVVNVNFKPTYYAKLVSAPTGGSGPSIEIKVQSK